MSAPLLYLLLFCIGGLAGLFYFGGLWLTIKKTTNKKGMYFWFFSSFLLRTAVVIAVFLLFMDGDWRRILTMMTGFLFVRFIFTSRIKMPVMPLAEVKKP